MLWTASGPVRLADHPVAPLRGRGLDAVGRRRRARAGRGAQRAGRRSRWPAVLAAQQLAGSFDMSAMGALLAAARDPARARRGRAPGRAPRTAGSSSGVPRARSSLAVGLSAGQWMATLEAAAHSGRRVASPRDPDVLVGASPDRRRPRPPRLQRGRAGLRGDAEAQLFEGREPFLASLYLGLPAWASCSPRSLDRAPAAPRAGSWPACAALALLVALGRHAPFYDLLVAALPPLQPSAIRSRPWSLVALAWCLLAAIGRRRLARAIRARRARGASRAHRAALGGTASSRVITAGALLALGRRTAPRAPRPSPRGWRGERRRRGVGRSRGAGPRTAPAAVAATVAVADLLLYHRSLNDVSPIDLYTHRPEVLRHLDLAPRRPRVRLRLLGGAPERAARAAPPERRLARMPAGWPVGPARRWPSRWR